MSPINWRRLRSAAAALVARGIPDEAGAQALAINIDVYVRWEWLAALGPAGVVGSALLEALDGPVTLLICRRAMKWARRHSTPEVGPVADALEILAEHDGEWLRSRLTGSTDPGDAPAVMPGG